MLLTCKYYPSARKKDYELFLKDTLKDFDDFRNKQQKYMK